MTNFARPLSSNKSTIFVNESAPYPLFQKYPFLRPDL